MAILAISHVMKSTGYERQNHRFRVFRQSQQKHAIHYHDKDVGDITTSKRLIIENAVT